MTSRLDKLTDRVLGLFGLDFSVEIGRAPFHEIAEGLYLGSRPRPERVADLKAAGISHVVSCLQGEQKDELAFLEADFDHCFIALRDGMNEDIASVLPGFFAFADKARRRTAKLLVHCEVGVSRSATLVTALVMQRSQKRFIDAYREVRAKRAEVLPNIGFASQLQRLEHDMFEQAPGVSSLATYLKEVCMVPTDIETLESALVDHDYDAPNAIRAIFGDEIPRVVQGARR